MSRVKRYLFGWKPSDFETYRKAYFMYGGSVNTHPDIIDFFIHEEGMKFNFFHYKNKDKLQGAYFLSENGKPGLNVWSTYPVTYDELAFPLNPNFRMVFPEITNRLAVQNRSSFINANYIMARRKKICLVKNEFSIKSVKKRKGEYRRFLDASGECVGIEEFSSHNLAAIYTYLFNMRFEGKLICYDKYLMSKFISKLKHLMFGHVLFVNGKPCAFDFMMKAESESAIYFDVPNGGVDPSFYDLSPGSVLMWKNIEAAKNYSILVNKKMTFSIGLQDKNWDYKERWANALPLGKTFF